VRVPPLSEGALERYRDTSLVRKRKPLGPCSRPVPRVMGGSWGGGRLLISEVPMYIDAAPQRDLAGPLSSEEGTT